MFGKKSRTENLIYYPYEKDQGIDFTSDETLQYKEVEKRPYWVGYPGDGKLVFILKKYKINK